MREILEAANKQDATYDHFQNARQKNLLALD